MTLSATRWNISCRCTIARGCRVRPTAGSNRFGGIPNTRNTRKLVSQVPNTEDDWIQ
jgi:hypothetical protein